MLTIKLECNSYVLYDEDGEELESWDRSVVGDEVARACANNYKKGYEAGYLQGQYNISED